MGWVRIDDASFRHPKISGLSAAAKVLWLSALCHANDQMTDGRLTHADARVAAGIGGVKFAAHNELVKAHLWEPTKDGWLIHDFLDYQPSAEAEKRRRFDTKRRVQQHRARQRNSVTNDSGNGPVTQPPNPPPNPITKPPPPTNDKRGDSQGGGGGLFDQAIRILADRHLEANTTPVKNRQAWLQIAAQTIRAQHLPALNDYAHFTGTPQQLADLLEPPPKPVYLAPYHKPFPQP